MLLTPDLARVSNLATRENPSPLFVIGDGTVKCRNSLTNTKDYSWTSQWWGITTLAELIAVAKARTLIPAN